MIDQMKKEFSLKQVIKNTQQVGQGKDGWQQTLSPAKLYQEEYYKGIDLTSSRSPFK